MVAVALGFRAMRARRWCVKERVSGFEISAIVLFLSIFAMPTPLKTRKSTSSPVEMTSLPPAEMTNVEVKSQKRRKRRKVERGNASDIAWSKSLSECQLDLTVSVKQLAMERVRSTREKSLNGLLTPAGLRAIGIILEEFMMDRVQTLRNTPAASSSVIDDLQACIEKSEDETDEMNPKYTAIETDEGA